MRIVCLGGGPAGLYFAITMKLRNPDHEIVVVERNRPDDTFGWGVVLSDETLENLARNDPESASAIRSHFAYWDDIAVNYQAARAPSPPATAFAASAGAHCSCCCRRAPASSASSCASRPRWRAPPIYAEKFDLVVAADGLNSKVRREYAEHFRPEIDVRKCKFVWLGTHQKFDDAFTFIFEETEHGWVWAHAYQFDDDTATFIVECAEATWQKIRLRRDEPGGVDRQSASESFATTSTAIR